MSGFTKIIRLDDHTQNGEPTVRILTRDVLLRNKTASEASEYVKNITPVPGKTFVLVLAMGAYEYYGANRNGDAFSENPVPSCVEPGETLVDTYKSFEDAGIYSHHSNKDPDKSMGKVLKAWYNKEMHRVELLMELDNVKASEIIARINNGEFPAVSMGCRIKYDVCCRRGCYNKAPAAKDYCDHIKFHLGEIDLVTGEKNFVFNPNAKFFDISFVFRPADRIGYMMKKVADFSSMGSSAALGEQVVDATAKLATLRKLSEMTKTLLGDVATSNPLPTKNFTDTVLPKAIENSIELPEPVIDELAKRPLPVAMSTLDAAGIVPTTIEVTRIMVRRGAPGAAISPETADRVSGLQDKMLTLMSAFPAILASLEKSGLVKLSSSLIDLDLLKLVQPLMEKRSNFKDYIYRRTIGDRHPDEGYLDTQIVHTPSGETFRTNRRATEIARDMNLERNAKMALGIGATAGLGYKVLSSTKPGKVLFPAIAYGAYRGGKRIYNDSRIPEFQGTDLPVNTEVQKIGGFLSPTGYNDASVYASLAQEYHRDKQACVSVAQSAKRYSNAIKLAAAKHDSMQFLSNIDAYISQKIASDVMSVFTTEPGDSVDLGEINLGTFGEWLGAGLLA